ncbi:MAG: hypothetical protein MRY74_16835 [Neomegalonema sp.]|nr:hypothetical protein [Neomegalonema sp.]
MSDETKGRTSPPSGGSNPAAKPKTAAEQAAAQIAAAKAAAARKAAAQQAGAKQAAGGDPAAAKAAAAKKAAARQLAAKQAAARQAAAKKKAARNQPTTSVGAKTQALIVILVCFAASAALRAGGYVGEKIANADKPAAAETPVKTADAEAAGLYSTASTPDAKAKAPGGVDTEALSALAKEAMSALGRDPLDPAKALGLAHAKAPGERGKDAKRSSKPLGVDYASACPLGSPSAEAASLIDELRRREAELKAHAVRLDAREKKLKAFNKLVQDRLRQLEREKKVFSGLVASVAKASKKDISHLVTMYSKMKPKKAAEIFNTMDPGFAAGFLVRMRADKASSVLSLMEPKRAYAVSLRMAGRNLKPGDAATEPAKKAAPTKAPATAPAPTAPPAAKPAAPR